MHIVGAARKAIQFDKRIRVSVVMQLVLLGAPFRAFLQDHDRYPLNRYDVALAHLAR